MRHFVIMIHGNNTFYFVICKIVVTFVPMTKESVLYYDISTNQSLQPNKYNVKEFYIWSSKK